MPISYHLLGDTIWVTLSGQYTLEQARHVSSDILNDPAFREGMHVLLDARDSKVNPSYAQVKDRAEFLKSLAHHSSGRVAIVVSDPLRFGLSRMLSIYAGMQGLNIEAFMSLEEARAWINRR